MQFLIGLLASPLGLPLPTMWEYGILLLIQLGALLATWRFCAASVIHWVMRTLAALALWALSYAVMAAILWVIAHWQLALAAVIMAAIVYFAAFIMIKGFFCNAAHDEQHNYWEVRL